MKRAVDHAVINVLEHLDAAARRFQALGFTLTERGYHSLGSINHLMMFEHDYLELVGIEAGATKVRREVADSPMGLNGLVFQTDDARALHRELKAAGLPVLDPVDFDRPVELAGTHHLAAFTTVRIAEQFLPCGRVYFCEHKTPGLLWRPEWTTHANGATGLAEVVVVSTAPEIQASRLAAFAGVSAHAQTSGDHVLTLGGCRLTLTTHSAYRQRHGELGCSRGRHDGPAATDYMGALSIRTRSLDRLRQCLADAAAGEIEHVDRGDRISVAAWSAFDCALDFVE